MRNKRQKSAGTCILCGQSFPGAAMAKHVHSCFEAHRSVAEERGLGKDAGAVFHIVALGEDLATYWIHLAMSENAALKDLDLALRNIWLECCGHMSVFHVDGAKVGSSRMKARIGDLLGVGSRFIHEYDMGSTTTLLLEVVGAWEAGASASAEDAAPVPKRRRSGRNPQGLVLVARNDAPRFDCINCQAPAKHICVECACDGDAWLCGDCLASHSCGEEMALPIVNSPRMGVCGYTGD